MWKRYTMAKTQTFLGRLWGAVMYDKPHQSKKYTGDVKLNIAPWPWWRRALARVVVTFEVLVNHPFYFVEAHWVVPTARTIGRFYFWQSRMYRWATGFGPED